MRDRLRPAESLTTSVPAGKDPPFVLDQPTAVVGENRWPIDLPYPLLLAAAGREPSNAAIFLKHGATDCGPATATGPAEDLVTNKKVRKEARDRNVSDNSAARATGPGPAFLGRPGSAILGGVPGTVWTSRRDGPLPWKVAQCMP